MTWFHPPQLRIGDGIEEESRRATWLELFFDLVFVVAVSQAAHHLNSHLSILGYLEFIVLFLPLWWAWIGATLYANRFEVDDVGYRLLTAAQMLGVAAMAVNVHGGLAESSAGFALSYATVRLILVFQYIRAAKHVASARSLATHYAIGFAIAATLWILSAAVPIPLRFVFWGLGLIVDFATPLTAIGLQSRLMPHFEHLPERFGLFTIIVLGEAVIAVVNGVAEQKWDVGSTMTAVVGFGIAFSLWWIYFENVNGSALRSAAAAGRVQTMQFWLYGHLPLVIGLAGAGVAVEHLILADANTAPAAAVRWLFCGSVALCMLSLAVLHRTGVIFRCKARTQYRFGAAIALLLLAVIGGGLPAVALSIVTLIICISQVAQDIHQSQTAPNLVDGST